MDTYSICGHCGFGGIAIPDWVYLRKDNLHKEIMSACIVKSSMKAEQIIVLIVVMIPAILLASCVIICTIHDIIKKECEMGDFFRMLVLVGVVLGIPIWLSLDYVLKDL